MKIHQSVFQYLLCWHKHVQYIGVPDDGGDPIPWCFWSVFDLCEILNDRSAKQETVGVTLRITTTFPKFKRALWPKKFGWDNKVFGYIYTEITQTIFFRIIYQSSRPYLKPSASFANILCKSSSRILAYRSFHLNSEGNFANFIDLSFHHQITEVKSSS